MDAAPDEYQAILNTEQQAKGDKITLQDLAEMTQFHQPLQVQSHLEMPGILVQLGHIQRT